MAPDYPYPQSINDCYAATLYVIENCNELGGDISKFVLAGDSAGGNAVAGDFFF
jgi:acetyl esterase